MIPRNTALFESIKWAYQPIKQSARLAQKTASAVRRAYVLRSYLQQDGFKGLQVGSGPFRLEGWLCTDVVGTPGIDFALDICEPLPIPDDSFDAIYGSEVIEHIARAQVRPFLKEVLRVLRPGGVLRLTTPDVRAVCQIYLGLLEGSSLADHARTWLEDEFSPDIWINSMFRAWGHQWLWDFESLAEELRSCGFGNIERTPPQVTRSEFPQLGNLEVRYGVPAPPHCWPVSMILEATKLPHAEALTGLSAERSPRLAPQLSPPHS
jgi:predicted SAM-dependent methyltransferase